MHCFYGVIAMLNLFKMSEGHHIRDFGKLLREIVSASKHHESNMGNAFPPEVSRNYSEVENTRGSVLSFSEATSKQS